MDLDEVFQAYVNDLYRYLFSLSKNHHTAEDLVQETFYRAYLQLSEDDIQTIKPWLFKVAYHAFIDFTRKHSRVVITDEVHNQISIKTPESYLLEKEGFTALMNDIHSLKETEMHALVLCDLHQLSLKEAADILQLNINTLKSHLSRGRKKVVERVKERKRYDG
ncbi:sigma-70 family RNA polymerase sigma factor [Fredinandcohnia sp. QZ13]|uniref:sigma-70 family RNA polymerase sigma factor n=1 Tax=Fredinandcohnia sp. QZ13 TaxID=3073144 RepID=UPI0028535363|nr:sigma-70 family RNA polymerase sigma factor [Fredinandcohnia sp. QZ13]MDR4887815.1 sigma-70 family RNA polymerase sigma factor [Fredinandcohnia sp. QZ13]